MKLKTAYLLLLCLSPLLFYGQKGLTGVWTGKISNDSVTVRKDQSFEVALTQYREKVYGYTRATFLYNDTLYYILKRVKGSIEDGVCEITDDEVVSYRLPGPLDKGVKATIVFRMNRQDSSWHLDGKWSTKKTKRYYAITGSIQLREEADPVNSVIYTNLQELQLDKDVAQVLPASRKPETISVTASQEPKPSSTPASQQPITATVTAPAEKKPAGTPASTRPTTTDDPALQKKKADAIPTSGQTSVVKNSSGGDVTTGGKIPPQNKTIAADTMLLSNRKPSLEIFEGKKTTVPVTTTAKDVAVNKPGSTDAPAAPPAIFTKAAPAAVTAPLVVTAAAKVNERTNTVVQEIIFTSDSLELSLYDNGEVDGDTVSVLLNGDILLPKQMLKASAIRKTISTPAGMDEFTLLLYAENLGKYPPNTGLLIVKDGEETRQIRFSADLKQNASIIFRRKAIN